MLYQRHQDRIRLVVLDVNMPRMNGIELIQRLKSMNPTVHIIAISGLPANQEASLNAGAISSYRSPTPWKPSSPRLKPY